MSFKKLNASDPKILPLIPNMSLTSDWYPGCFFSVTRLPMSVFAAKRGDSGSGALDPILLLLMAKIEATGVPTALTFSLRATSSSSCFFHRASASSSSLFLLRSNATFLFSSMRYSCSAVRGALFISGAIATSEGDIAPNSTSCGGLLECKYLAIRTSHSTISLRKASFHRFHDDALPSSHRRGRMGGLPKVLALAAAAMCCIIAAATTSGMIGGVSRATELLSHHSRRRTAIRASKEGYSLPEAREARQAINGLIMQLTRQGASTASSQRMLKDATGTLKEVAKLEGNIPVANLLANAGDTLEGDADMKIPSDLPLQDETAVHSELSKLRRTARNLRR